MSTVGNTEEILDLVLTFKILILFHSFMYNVGIYLNTIKMILSHE